MQNRLTMLYKDGSTFQEVVQSFTFPSGTSTLFDLHYPLRMDLSRCLSLGSPCLPIPFRPATAPRSLKCLTLLVQLTAQTTFAFLLQ